MKNLFKGLLEDLPSPPEGKIGWPWTKETDPKVYRDDIIYPKISIVTPSFNQYQFIEETIRSILLQNYPNLEYIIIDGGSTDNTIEIIKKYEPWITYWVSEKDNGQGHALNKGFERATGELVGWQNSDDIYLKDAFNQVVTTFVKYPYNDIYYGKIYHLDNNSNVINELHFIPFSFFVLKYHDVNIANQGAFFKNKIIKENIIDTSFFFTMDAEYYFRLASKGAKFYFVPKFIGGFRIQQNSKTCNYINISKQETNNVRRMHGVNVIDSIPWSRQFIVNKFLAHLYILPYKIYYGGLWYYLKKRLFK